MKLFTLLAVTLMTATILPSNAFAAKWNLDASHTRVGFKVAHLAISSVKGEFTKKEGTFDFDDATGTLKDVVVKIDVKSLNTNDAKRDEHLKSPDFFNSDKFPTIEFKSTKVESKGGKPVKVMGKLTMAGVTKDVTLDVKYAGTIVNPWGVKVAAFEASTKLDRMDYGIKWNKALDKGGVVVGEEVTIAIEGEANP